MGVFHTKTYPLVVVDAGQENKRNGWRGGGGGGGSGGSGGGGGGGGGGSGFGFTDSGKCCLI